MATAIFAGDRDNDEVERDSVGSSRLVQYKDPVLSDHTADIEATASVAHVHLATMRRGCWSVTSFDMTAKLETGITDTPGMYLAEQRYTEETY